VRNAEVWITGIGAATPLGHSYHDFADNLLAGRSGIRFIEEFDVDQHPSQIAGFLGTIPCPADWDPEEFHALERQRQLPIWCCSEALRDAGWWEERHQVRVGLVLGNGGEWPIAWETNSYSPGKPIVDSVQENESIVGHTSRRLGLSGPCATISAACASGNLALAQARRLLQLGWVDVCLAGACDVGVTPLALAGFGNLRALSRRNHEPHAASRPFDQDRDGFVMAEGGAIFVLESAEMARRRSARVYASVAGCGASSDAYNMVMPSPNPAPAIRAVRGALAEARIAAADIDYINAHATGTPVGDAAEARVLAGVLDAHLDRVPVSSTKSMTGHLLTAAAAVEVMACLTAMERSALPPTVNLERPDPNCRLHHVANQARPARVRVTVSNSFGFGGSNTCLVLRAA
jgi:3-oxoacyl-[acyl-carrier-protein] synthase II